MRRKLKGLALAAATACGHAFAVQMGASDPGPWLIFDVAKSVYATENQGGNFVVEIKHGDKREIVHRVLWGSEAGVWLPQGVNLRDYAGERVKVRLQTIAAYYFSASCFLFWGRPRIVAGPLDGPSPPTLVADLTENFRLGKDCRRYVHDAENSGPLKTDQYDFTGGYGDHGQAGPHAQPALFCHPFCYGSHSWAGYEFEVTLPRRPSSPPQPSPTLRPPSPTRDYRGADPAVLWWEEQVYKAHEGGAARVDPDTMRLQVRMPDTQQGFGYAFAGLELIGRTALDLQVELESYEPWAAYGEMADNRFVGVVLDYHTARGYTRRVWLHHSPIKPEHPERRCERRAPTWHMHLTRLRRVQEVNWEQLHRDLPPGRRLHLDLERWAPPEWDGRCWFGIGIQDAGSGRTFEAKVLEGKSPAR